MGDGQGDWTLGLECRLLVAVEIKDDMRAFRNGPGKSSAEDGRR